jgi:hypothetical protein
MVAACGGGGGGGAWVWEIEKHSAASWTFWGLCLDIPREEQRDHEYKYE